MTELADPVDDGFCIACGPASEFGLRMRFTELPDGSVESRATIPSRFQGWRDVVHGGIVAMLLDEAMAYAAGARGVLGVTGELKMRFPEAGADRCGRARARQRHVGAPGAWLGVNASVSDEAGKLLASAEGRFVSRGTVAPGERFGTFDGR